MTEALPAGGPVTRQAAQIASSLEAVGKRLQTSGLDDAEIEEALNAIRSVGRRRAYAARVAAAIAQPAHVAERLRAAAPAPVTAAAVLVSLLAGAAGGVLLSYALLSDPHTLYFFALPRWPAGVGGALLTALCIAVAARTKHPGQLGALAGVAGGLAQVILAALPWLTVAGPTTSCNSSGDCVVGMAAPLGVALLTAAVFATPFTLMLASVTSATGLWVTRRRFAAAVRRA